MAAAEARAAWQRAANRYFVQEDAKRAPRLACCPSSTLLSKQTDTGHPNSGSDPDHRSVGFMPSKRTPSYSNLPPDAKWWLQMEPNYGLHRGLNLEQSKSTTATETSAPLTSITDSSVREVTTMCEESIYSFDCEDLESFLDVKKSSESKMEEISVVAGKINQDFLDVKNMTDNFEVLGMEMDEVYVCKRTSEFSSGADPLIGGEKVPWWRVTDGEELASLVAQKSLHHIENCDLPPPQKMLVRRERCKLVSLVNHDESPLSSVDSLDWVSPPSGESMRKRWSSLKEGPSHVQDAATEPLRSNSNSAPEKGRTPISDPCRAKLLEALCHSQTRAREAEKAAKQAYTEKEHLLKLFFRQASHLFAYKQWFKLLQLETLLLQSKEGDPPPLTAFPELLPWVPQKPRKLHKNWQKPIKAKRRKRSSEENDIGKYCVAFAVGFTLVGAGLILGWTAGWLFPAF